MKTTSSPTCVNIGGLVQGQEDYEHQKPSHIPTPLRNLNFLVKTGSLGRRLGIYELTWEDDDQLHLRKEHAIVHRKHQEYLYQAFFSIPTEHLASNSLLLMQVREVIIASRLQMQVFLRQARVKYQAIKESLSDEENGYAQACFEEIERMEQQYRTKEDGLKPKILTQWGDFSNFRSWYIWEHRYRQNESLQVRRNEWQRGMSSDDEASNTRVDRVAELLLDVELKNLPEEDQQCNICTEPYSSKEDTEEFSADAEKPVRVPSCGHIFGDTCIKQWLEQSTTCPICRQDFPELAGIWPAIHPPWLIAELHRIETEVWPREQESLRPEVYPELGVYPPTPDARPWYFQLFTR